MVDSPFVWGQIAAANALSDIYAMAAQPLTAIQVVGWPRGQLGLEVLDQVLLGGAERMHEAGCVIVGGHSIDNPAPVYGFAITGICSSENFLTKQGAKPGDQLLLTKPLGTGIVASAIKAGECPPDLEQEAIDSMVSLNRAAAELGLVHGAKSMTDISGFGLLGHLQQMLTDNLSARLLPTQIPIFPGVHELLVDGHWPGGSQRNLEAAQDSVRGNPDSDILRITCDAQTSGGLLQAVPPEKTYYLSACLKDVGVGSFVLGEVTEGPTGTVFFE